MAYVRTARMPRLTSRLGNVGRALALCVALPAVAAFSVGLSPPDQQATRPPSSWTEAFELCRSALRGSDPGGDAVVAQPAAATVCFAGRIDGNAASRILTTLGTVPEAAKLTFVGNSLGGQPGPALDIAEELLRRNTTFIAGPICASSCANYLFLPSRTRIIPAGSIVIFHGGMSTGFIDARRRELRMVSVRSPKDAAKEHGVQDVLARAVAARSKQQSMLAAIGADTNFFEFFDRIPAGRGSKLSKDCGELKAVNAYVLSDEFLRSRGIDVHVNFGPQSPEQLRDLLAKRSSRGSSETCFWR